MKKNVIEYLKETVNRYPNKIAFSDVNGDMTFTELDNIAKKIAVEIIRRTNGIVNSPIAVEMPKGKECIAVFMGIIYSGNYYSPIDISMPRERINLILQNLDPILIISYKKEAEKYCSYEFCLRNNIDEMLIKNQLHKIISADPVYVLFTSGSTGIPKGVVISHEAVIDYVEWLKDKFDFNSNTIFGNQAPLYFDNSILDIYSTIKNGSTMCFIEEKLFAFPNQLIRFMYKKGVNTIFWVPSAMIAVAESNALESAEKLPQLEKILFCGEVMPTKQLSKWMSFYKETVFVNLYGPTEITDVCTYFIVDRTYKDEEVLPIGKACENMDVFIINKENKQAGIGEIGEILVRGIGISKGYYKDDDKSQASFIQNPLHKNYRDIVYKTGDMGKIDENGNIIYIGRADNQIKYQGHRIELGEIEKAAISVQGVKRACAVYSDVRNRIVLFVTLTNCCLTEKDIYIQIKQKLPKYMLPSEINIFEAMPLNVNGKIDRISLKERANGTGYKRDNC